MHRVPTDQLMLSLYCRQEVHPFVVQWYALQQPARFVLDIIIDDTCSSRFSNACKYFNSIGFFAFHGFVAVCRQICDVMIAHVVRHCSHNDIAMRN